MATVMAGRNRMKASELLKSATRLRIVADVRRAPGSGAADVARRCGLSYGGAAHHLAQLQRRGLLVVAQQGSRVRYYPPGAHAPHAPGMASLAVALPRRGRSIHVQ